MNRNDINVRLRTDNGRFRAEMQRASATVRGFSSTVAGAAIRIGAMGAGLLGLNSGFNILQQQLDRFDRVGKIATTLDEPVEAIQRLEVAAELTGTTLETVLKSATDLERKLGEASENPAAARALERLNLNAEEFTSLGVEERVSAIARAYQQAANPAQAYADLTQLLGRGARDLLPLLKEGADGVARLTSEIQTLDDSEVRGIEEFNDRLTLIRKSLEAQVASAFADNLEEVGAIAETVATALLSSSKFILENTDAIRALVLAYAGFRIGGFLSANRVLAASAIRSAGALTAVTLGLNKESVALARNTTAQSLNTRARQRLQREFSLAGVQGTLRTGLNNLGPIVAAGIAGWEVGKLLEEQFMISERVLEGLFGESDRILSAGNDLIQQSRQRVDSAQSERELRAATLQIEEELSSLRDQQSGAGRSERESLAQTATVLENILQNAAAMNTAARERATLAEGEKATAQELSTVTEERARKEREVTEEQLDQLRTLRSAARELTGDLELELFNEEDSSAQIQQLTDQLETRFRNLDLFLPVGVEIDRENLNFQELIDGLDLSSAGGDPEFAQGVLSRIQQIRETQERIATVQGEINENDRARIALVSRLNLLEAEASGDTERATAIQTQTRLLSAQREIQETLGVSKERALQIAERQLHLEQQIASAGEGNLSIERQIAIAREAHVNGITLNDAPSVDSSEITDRQTMLGLAEEERATRAQMLAEQAAGLSALIPLGQELSTLISSALSPAALQALSQISIAPPAETPSATPETPPDLSFSELLRQNETADEQKIRLLTRIADGDPAPTRNTTIGNGLI